jgi:hypothetical protein
MSKIYRGPPIDATYQASVNLVKQFQRRRLLEIDQSETRICLWWPYLLTDRNEMSNLHRESSIDASYQVLKRFQRRRILKISQSETRIACGGHVC